MTTPTPAPKEESMRNRYVCVRCGRPVKALVNGIGTLVHPGHVDSTADTPCGTWGFRRAAKGGA